ncbi:MAG: TIGR01906 family membrane protein [Limosilactobacillus sp.]|uniref:TIGR01906 family membrane protein n=1 Tax=Limosilactobacillus sp. TaxID=2773925 RepID=UPI0025C18807|nr:TIGR01906 family membrane protein [Limosilactobacillus sp.]MCI1975397.1 TIGR01906 family membrane protein [Limosilactobacillus sp.]
MRVFMKSACEVLIYLLAAFSIAVIITTNISIFLLHSFKYGSVTQAEILSDYRHLLMYLQYPFVSQLKLQYLPISNSATMHFQMVRRLLIANEILCPVCWGMIIINSRNIKKRSQLLWLISLINYVCIFLLMFIGLTLVNFESSFVNFHYLLFGSNRDWIFNPKVDPIILAMPPSFFLELFCICFGTVILILILIRYYNRRNLFRGKFRL